MKPLTAAELLAMPSCVGLVAVRIPGFTGLCWQFAQPVAGVVIMHLLPASILDGRN